MVVPKSSVGHELRSHWSRELHAGVALASFARAVYCLILEFKGLKRATNQYFAAIIYKYKHGKGGYSSRISTDGNKS